MTKWHQIASGVLFMLGACGMSAAAQDPLQDSVAVTQAARRLGQLLQEYVVAQERYFVDHHGYADSVATLELSMPVGAHVEVVQASETGHSAVATLGRFPSIRCGIWVGNAAAPLDTESDEGRPACIVEERAPSRTVASCVSSLEGLSAASRNLVSVSSRSKKRVGLLVLVGE